MIDGPSAGVTISGGHAVEVFNIASGVTALLSGLTITEGSSNHNGGGLYNRGTLTLTGCTISGNSADSGGALFVWGGTLTLTDCNVSGNSAWGGGGLDGFGTLTLTDCNISGNSANSTGGGLNISGTAILTDCTVSGNSAGGNGGGIYEAVAQITLTGCTVSGNSAHGYGGGLISYDPDRDGTLTLNDTIVAGNIDSGGASDIGGGRYADKAHGSYNLIGPGGSGGIVDGTNGNIVLPDLSRLGLAPLGDYGGSTMTMALLPGSAAISHGTEVAGVTTDQRGLPLHAPTPDIGAFQTNPLIVNTTIDGTGSPSGDVSLSQAINLANTLGGPETIIFDPAVFAAPQTITLSMSLGTLNFTDTTGLEAIDGPADGVIISGGDSIGVLAIPSGVTATLSGLTIKGGSAADGGGIENSGTLSLTGCIVSGNRADNGGGVWNDGVLTLTGCTVSGNHATYDGGGAFNNGTMTLTGCTVSGNSSYNFGGGLAASGGTAAITNSTISGNSAGGNGGGLSNSYGVVTVTACTISVNSASVGGGLYNQGSTATATLNDTIVASNTGSVGDPNDIDGPDADNVTGSYNLIGIGGSGGITDGEDHNVVLTDLSKLGLGPLGGYGGPTQTMALLPGSAAIGKGTPAGLTTDQRGFPLDSPPDIGSFQVQPAPLPLVVNSTGDGIGILPGKLSLRAAINLADVQGGDRTITFDSTVFTTSQTITLSADLGPLNLTDTTGRETIDGPAVGVTIDGGNDVGVFTISTGVTALLSGLTIAGGSAVDGGGIDNSGALTLNGCTITGNTAGSDGGGIDNLGSLTLINCTVSGNSAGTGGGLYNDGGTIILTDCTVSGNSAGSGGGLDNASPGTATLTDTIVALNTDSGGASDIAGSAAGNVTGTYNLIGTGGHGGITGPSNLIDVANPGLLPLGDYGGPTMTMAILPDSVAIGKGTTGGGITTDQRGAPRPTSVAVDIGAFQDQGYSLTVVSGSPQSTLINTSFGAPLAVVLTENFAQSPIPGVSIAFTAPSSGPSATLSASTAVTDPNGRASVTATANGTAGTYVVTASAAGVGSSASFHLTNQIQPSFTLTD